MDRLIQKKMVLWPHTEAHEDAALSGRFFLINFVAGSSGDFIHFRSKGGLLRAFT